VDSPNYSESELFGDAVTVFVFFEVPLLVSDALLTTLHPLLENVLQFIASFRKIVEQADVIFFYVRFSVSKALPPLENRSLSHCIVSIGLMDEL
jgi:hypothetical protein